MSAFLGPIHHWLYNKIKIQHDIVEDIISLTENKQLNLNMKEKLIEQYGDAEMKPLEEVIDVNNIHGWLQKKVSLEENRLAYAVTKLLNENASIMNELKSLFKNKGAEVSTLTENDSVNDIYKTINDTLLDGMPCDHANIVISQEDEEVIWKRNVCVHEDYWNAVGGDISNYYLLREEFIKGMLEKANVTYDKLDETTSKISRR